jgi:hypothetical protein
MTEKPSAKMPTERCLVVMERQKKMKPDDL